MIHTTVGVYPNGSWESNGVPSEYLAEHIAYNIKNRVGRAMYLDGILIYKGINCIDAIKNSSGIYKQIKHDKNTAPYK